MLKCLEVREYALDEGLFDSQDMTEIFIRIMQLQINHQKETDKYSTIGGEIHYLTLAPNNQSMWTVHRFDDHMLLYDSMMKKIKNEI